MLASALACASFCACGGGERQEDLAEAVVALTSAPADALCIRIVVVGAARTATRNFDTGAGSSSVFSLAALPTGDVIFFADAFGSVCGQVTAASMHTWYGVPTRATLTAGTPANVTIAMHR